MTYQRYHHTRYSCLGVFEKLEANKNTIQIWGSRSFYSWAGWYSAVILHLFCEIGREYGKLGRGRVVIAW